MISDDMATPRRLGAFVLALDPDAFSGADAFRAVISRYLAAVRIGPKPGDTVMAAGDREWKEAARRRAEGIILDAATLDLLARFAAEHDLAPLRTRARA